MFVTFSELARAVGQHSTSQYVCARLRSYSSHRQRIVAFVSLGVFLFILLGSLVFSNRVLIFGSEKVSDAMPFSSFDLVDAEDYCGKQIAGKLGKSLLRYYIDDHSSRLDPRRGIFRVYLKADVGEMRDFSEITVHCFVDQWEAKLNYYREFNPNVKTIKSTDIKFFSN